MLRFFALLCHPAARRPPRSGRRRPPRKCSRVAVWLWLLMQSPRRLWLSPRLQPLGHRYAFEYRSRYCIAYSSHHGNGRAPVWEAAGHFSSCPLALQEAEVHQTAQVEPGGAPWCPGERTAPGVGDARMFAPVGEGLPLAPVELRQPLGQEEVAPEGHAEPAVSITRAVPVRQRATRPARSKASARCRLRRQEVTRVPDVQRVLLRPDPGAVAAEIVAVDQGRPPVPRAGRVADTATARPIGPVPAGRGLPSPPGRRGPRSRTPPPERPVAPSGSPLPAQRVSRRSPVPEGFARP